VHNVFLFGTARNVIRNALKQKALAGLGGLGLGKLMASEILLVALTLILHLLFLFLLHIHFFEEIRVL
jgi:hypothetical protein